MLTTSQKETFDSRGLIRLEGFLPAEKVARAREVILRALGRQGVWRDGTWHLDELPLSTAPNAARVPRIMLTQRFLLESLRGAVYGRRHSDDPEPP